MHICCAYFAFIYDILRLNLHTVSEFVNILILCLRHDNDVHLPTYWFIHSMNSASPGTRTIKIPSNLRPFRKNHIIGRKSVYLNVLSTNMREFPHKNAIARIRTRTQITTLCFTFKDTKVSIYWMCYLLFPINFNMPIYRR